MAYSRSSLSKTATYRLKGKVALVTGASRGIGTAIARALAAEGCRLILTARDAKKLEKVGRELKAVTIAADVRDPVQVGEAFRELKKRFARLDIVVNNAGIGHGNQNVEELPYEVWRDVIATNLDGLFLVTHLALPLMKRGGAIVNNLSIAAKRVFPGSSAYNASKHGALGLTDTLREELRPKGIRVIALLPGATDTDIWKTLWPEAPRQRMLQPETVARAVVDALKLPDGGCAEEIILRPAAGTL